MPLVKRILDVENDTTTFSKEKVPHVTYVPPEQVRPTDVIVEPSSPRQLAELAELYPDEYGEKAEAAGVTPGGDAVTDGATGIVAKIAKMNAKDAIAAINELDEVEDAEVLGAVFEFELARGDNEEDPPEVQPRATVLAALERKGFSTGEGTE